MFEAFDDILFKVWFVEDFVNIVFFGVVIGLFFGLGFVGLVGWLFFLLFFKLFGNFWFVNNVNLRFVINWLKLRYLLVGVIFFRVFVILFGSFCIFFLCYLVFILENFM